MLLAVVTSCVSPNQVWAIADDNVCTGEKKRQKKILSREA